jgi:hypothetical protein
MKKIFTVILCMSVLGSYAQNVGVGTNRPLSKLHVAGDLRVDSLAATKDSGLVLHNEQGVLRSLKFTGKKEDVLHGDGTFAAAAATGAWDLMGNAGTDPAVNFLGTTDNKPLIFKIFNQPAGRIETNGNTGLGFLSLKSVTTGNVENGHNTAFGRNTLEATTTGHANTAVGSTALQNNVVGDHNTAVGVSVLSNARGSFNTGIGAFALNQAAFESSSYNTAVGYFSLQNASIAEYNVAIGEKALFSAEAILYTVAIGSKSLFSNTTGLINTAVGSNTLYSNTSGSNNIAEGYNALYYNSTGSDNTAIGTFALAANTSASRNTAVGSVALTANTTGKYNVGVGYGALLKNTIGTSNAALGHHALVNNRTGHNLVAVGDSALLNNFSASFNTSIGKGSMLRTTTGGGNTGLGHLALSLNTTGINNTAVGKGADVTGQFSNATAIGYNAKVDASNKVRIGNASVTKIEGQVPFTTPSDGRYKFNVQENVSGLSFIMRLRPVTYQFDVKRFDHLTDGVTVTGVTQAAYNRAAEIRRTGFIAQEVESAAKEAGYNFSGISSPQNDKEYYSLSYESFVVPLVKAVQEQQFYIAGMKKHSDESSDRVQALESKIATQQEMINRQQQQIDQLMTELKKLTALAENK